MRMDDGYRAYRNRCPLLQGPVCTGPVSGTRVANANADRLPVWDLKGRMLICAWHSMKFELDTGRCLRARAERLRAYPVELSEDQVFVLIGRRPCAGPGGQRSRSTKEPHQGLRLAPCPCQATTSKGRPVVEVPVSSADAANPAVDEVDDEQDLGVEPERDASQITHPFKPEQIKISTDQTIVDLMVSRIDHKAIDLSPDFQRHRGIWSYERRSRLIESLLLRIPIPVFYVAADESDNWSVVDGVQRMSTIYDYVTGSFALNRLQYLTDLEGLVFEDLPWSMQRRIRETTLIVNVIQPGTPPEVMFNIFLRINTGGMVLNAQEIRHALHPGPVREYLSRLVESEEFKRATDGSINPKRMSDRECVLRFLAFYIDGWESYSENNLDGYLGSVMEKLNRMSMIERENIFVEFKKAMRAGFEIFGLNAFRKPPQDGRFPINRSLFEAWAVQFARCPDSQLRILVERRDAVQASFRELMTEDEDFNRSVSLSTGAPARVRKRFAEIEYLVQEIVEC